MTKKNNNNIWASVFLFVLIALSISCKKADDAPITAILATSLEASKLFTEKPNEDHVTDYAPVACLVTILYSNQ